MLDVIQNNFELPFQPYPFQTRIADAAFRANRALISLKVGKGKTLVATLSFLMASELSNISSALVLVPAPLVHQWSKWFSRIKIKGLNKPLSVLEYTGTPAKRAKMVFNTDCIVMSHHIFRKDYARILSELGKKPNVMVIYDEAQDGLRKKTNKIWKYLTTFIINKPFIALSGTPANTPEDMYGLLGILDPFAYPTRRSFENEHIENRDFWGQVTEWKNLDILRDRFYSSCFDINPDEDNQVTPSVIDKVSYQLSSQHKIAYDELAESGWLTVDGQTLTALQTKNLFHMLQQFITSPDKLRCPKFSVDNLAKLLFAICDEDDSKMVIFGNYRNTNNTILDALKHQYGDDSAVGVWGDVDRGTQQKNLELFKDPNSSVRWLVGNPKSLGVGTDGLQDVCFRVAFVEMPLTPSQFEQACGRVDREGQKNRPCVIRCLVAENTIQESLFDAFLNKSDLLQMILHHQVDYRKFFNPI